MVIIQPSGGLCNRMRVINSSLELAKRKNAKLLVLWYVADELNAPFESLFQPVDEFKVINFTSLKDLRKLWYQLTARTRVNNADIENNTTNGTLNQDFFDSIKLPAYIFTWEHFYDADEKQFVIISDNNVANYINHNFVKDNGTKVKLVDYSIKTI